MISARSEIVFECFMHLANAPTFTCIIYKNHIFRLYPTLTALSLSLPSQLPYPTTILSWNGWWDNLNWLRFPHKWHYWICRPPNAFKWWMAVSAIQYWNTSLCLKAKTFPWLSILYMQNHISALCLCSLQVPLGALNINIIWMKSLMDCRLKVVIYSGGWFYKSIAS